MAQRNLAETEQLIIYTLDNTAAAADPARNPLGQFLCLFDLSGAARQCFLRDSVCLPASWAVDRRKQAFRPCSRACGRGFTTPLLLLLLVRKCLQVRTGCCR